MPDYSDLTEVKNALDSAQETEEDNRQRARDVNHFLEKDDGQWEPSVKNGMSNRPRYTFDKCNPVVDSIAGELEQASFTNRIRPASGEASKDVATVMGGMIRNIESISDASDKVYNAAGRKMIKTGFDAWMVKHDWIDDESFEQDLFIRKIANAIDRVWFDEDAQEQDMSDANHVFLLHVMTPERFKEKWPNASCQSLSNSRTNEVYEYKSNFIVFGQIFYKKPVIKELALMNNGKVHVIDEEFEKVRDELKQKGVTVKRTRKRESTVVFSRLFDDKDWLEDAKETVFKWLPIIPVYGNFDVSEDKIIYRGAINKLMDSQRVYNYAQSRQVEEGALAPREKLMMTEKQAVGHIDTLQTMNTNAEPVQLYNHVPDEPPPFKLNGASINPGLAQVSNDMKGNITEGSGIFAANQGDAPNQSGYAIELQQNKGDNSTIKYFTSLRIGIVHTCRILINAFPKVYDTPRMVRVLGEDGAEKIERINEPILDEESGEVVRLIDVRTGKYDVVCDVGPAFKNQQQATSKAFLEIAGIDPTILQDGSDIWLANLDVPGMSAMAERRRKQLFEAGRIPDDQMTDEEKLRAQQMLAQAEAEQAAAAQQGPTVMEQAVIAQTQAQTAETQSRIDERLAKISQQDRKLSLNEAELALKAGGQSAQQNLDEAKFAQQSQNDTMQLIFKQNAMIVEALNKQAETLKILREAAGVDAIVGPGVVDSYISQTDIVQDAQEKQ